MTVGAPIPSVTRPLRRHRPSHDRRPLRIERIKRGCASTRAGRVPCLRTAGPRRMKRSLALLITFSASSVLASGWIPFYPDGVAVDPNRAAVHSRAGGHPVGASLPGSVFHGRRQRRCRRKPRIPVRPRTWRAAAGAADSTRQQCMDAGGTFQSDGRLRAALHSRVQLIRHRRIHFIVLVRGSHAPFVNAWSVLHRGPRRAGNEPSRVGPLRVSSLFAGLQRTACSEAQDRLGG